MDKEQYYPCIKDLDDGDLKRVGPAMSFQDAVLYLKQHYTGAWHRGTACAEPISNPVFVGEVIQQKTD